MLSVGRPSWRSSLLGDPGAKFLCGKLERGTKKEKSSKKERKEGLWKLTLLMEIRKERRFPQQLEKSLAKDARLFHSSHRPNSKDLSTMYCRQRSTLRTLNSGPKNGEHLTLPEAGSRSNSYFAKGSKGQPLAGHTGLYPRGVGGLADIGWSSPIYSTLYICSSGNS